MSDSRETLTNSPEHEVVDASISIDGHNNGKISPISPVSRANSIQYDGKPSDNYQNMRHSHYIVHKNTSPRTTKKRGMGATSVPYTDHVPRQNTSITAHHEHNPHHMMASIIPTTNGIYVQLYYPRTQTNKYYT